MSKEMMPRNVGSSTYKADVAALKFQGYELRDVLRPAVNEPYARYLERALEFDRTRSRYEIKGTPVSVLCHAAGEEIWVRPDPKEIKPVKEEKKTKPRIVCSAIKLKEGIVICSPRHFDMLCNKTLEALGIKPGDHRLNDHFQGFVDSYGEFHNRRAAFEIASKARQIKYVVPGAGDGLLNSEHLY